MRNFNNTQKTSDSGPHKADDRNARNVNKLPLRASESSFLVFYTIYTIYTIYTLYTIYNTHFDSFCKVCKPLVNTAPRPLTAGAIVINSGLSQYLIRSLGSDQSWALRLSFSSAFGLSHRLSQKVKSPTVSNLYYLFIIPLPMVSSI